MNKYLRWFSRVVWIGLIPNMYFAVPAFFVPGYVTSSLDLNPGFETVWLRNAGLLIFLISLYNVVAALAPDRYPVVSWLVVAGRLLAAAFWLQIVLFGNLLDSTETGTPFIFFFLGDVTLGTIGAVLLYLGLRDTRTATSEP